MPDEFEGGIPRRDAQEFYFPASPIPVNEARAVCRLTPTAMSLPRLHRELRDLAQEYPSYYSCSKNSQAIDVAERRSAMLNFI